MNRDERDGTAVEMLGAAWLASRFADAVEAGDPPTPEALEASLRDAARRVVVAPEARAGETRGERYGRLAYATTRGRGRRRALARLGGHLLARGVDPLLVLALLQAQNLVRCTPPLHPEQVEDVVRWVAAQEAERLEGRAA